MRRTLIVGNWKMNGSKASVKSLLEGFSDALGSSNVEVAVCPAYPYISLAHSLLEGSQITVCAQNCSAERAGAYTGEVAIDMLVDLCCQWVLVGHSERRVLYAETDETILKKYIASKSAGLQPILCVGETLEERDHGQAFDVVASQLKGLLSSTELDRYAVLAYEPVWAIGTGKTATSAEAQEMHAFIRSQVSAIGAGIADSVRILYGGSVKAGNAAELFQQADIDGGLVGGASLVQEEFVAIAKAANQIWNN